MYCEKCGKANPENQTKCKYCGALMPQKTSCGGFGDILSYENSEPGIKEGVTVMNQAPVTAPDKTSSLAPILSIVAIGVSVVAIILSIAAMLMSASGNDAVEDADDVTEATEEMDVKEEPDDTDDADEELPFVVWLNDQSSDCKQDVKDAFSHFYKQYQDETKALESICEVSEMKKYASEQPGKIQNPDKWAEKVSEEAEKLTKDYNKKTEE